MDINKDYQSDFTFDNYCALLDLAKANYRFVNHKEALSASDRFIIWRHDIDQSINRAVRLAVIEAAKGISATYFLNPHCDFYSLLEHDQHRKVGEIIRLGHEIGLHFDAHFYTINSEAELDQLVAKEAGWLREWFGVEVATFSFHNPNSFLLTCEKEEYGGLINCYSNKFKKQIAYCSDSNGYWRHRRLYDVLVTAGDYCLQVLTHPECWQEMPMSPRERFFRCVDGRATAVMRRWDYTLAINGRGNQGSLMSEFEFLKKKFGRKAELLDYRWMRGEAVSVFVDLWQIFESQLVKFCRIWFRKALQISSVEAKAVIESDILKLPMHLVFAAIYQKSWGEISGVEEDKLLAWQQVRNHLVHGFSTYARDELEQGVIFIVQVMKRLSDFCEAHSVVYDELRPEVDPRLPLHRVNGEGCLKWLSENSVLLGLEYQALQRFAESQSVSMRRGL